VAVLVACGGGGAGGTTGPDPAVEPFVGTWDAEVFTVTNLADTNVVADLMEDGSFFIVIEPSGFYTATLVFGQFPPVTEFGHIVVTGNFVTLRPLEPDPCPASSEYTFTTPTYLTLTGPTCFDFNLDGEDEDAEAHLELRRR
jgi:hypothetical protein